MSDRSSPTVTIDDIESASARLDDPSVVKPTPVERSTSLESMTGADRVYLKMEHLQWTGSFKPRGSLNKIRLLAAAGSVRQVVAASAGNHAQGVALAANTAGLDATIVMPETAPQAKIDATRDYGATVELVGRDFRAATAHAKQLANDPDTAFIHAYDDPAVVAGQGTLGLEILDSHPDLDTIVVPIGGGGLIGGIATVFQSRAPETRVVGVQAEGAATVPDSLAKGAPQSLEEVDTIADGIATGGISELTLRLISERVDEIVTVTNDDIARAILILLERAKQLVEGAGATPAAAILGPELDITDETVLLVLSGGNLDMTMLQTVLIHALTRRRQILRLRVKIDDRPGKLADISGVIAEYGANIHTVYHDRAVDALDVGEAYLEFQIETSGVEHADRIAAAISDRGYEVTDMTRAD